MNQAWVRWLPRSLQARLEGRYSLQKILSNTGWLFADRVLRMSLGLLVGVWVARYLGPEQFGFYSYVIAFVSLFSALATLGLDGIVVRDIVRQPACKEETLGTAFALKLLGGVVTLLLATVTITWLRPGDSLSQWLTVVIAVGMLFQALDSIDFWFQSQTESKYTIYAKSAGFVLINLVKIALIQRQAPLIAFAWAGSAETALGAAGLVLSYQLNGHHLKAWRITFSRAIELLKDSWPLILSGVMIMLYMRIDQVMLGQSVGDQEVGIYSAAVKLAEAWYFIPIAIVSSMFPNVVEAKSISEDLFYARLQKLYNWMAFLAYIVAIPMSLAAGPLIEVLFGSHYQAAGPMLSMLIWSGLFVNLGVARSSFLTTMNWTKVHFMTVALGCLVNIALNLVLIPRYGGMGAVIASCFAYWFAAQGTCLFYKPLFRTGYMLTRAMLYPKVW